MSPGGEATFGVRYTQYGYESVEQSLRRIDGQLKQVGRTQKQTARGATDLGRSFRNIALRTFTILGIVRTFRLVNDAIRKSISTGLEYNETIEQSRLAIATLITAQAELIDSNDRHLQGVEKLDAAYGLAVDQVRKLRIAGIQTAATTKELVDAFQQAVGAGLATGLTLDEIRTVTIRIAQAAGALGVPYRQLNEEIRSILGGIIDQNTRIAKALGLTNDQIRLAKEQGRLAEFLLESFEAFGVAGERIVETWSALKSNVAETLELFAGEVTFPLFEAVRKRGLESVQRIFDFDTAEIATEFAELVRQMQRVFSGIGEQFANTIEGVVNLAERLNNWLLENKEVAELTADEFGEMVSALGEMIRSVTGIGVGLAKWATEMKFTTTVAQTIADTFKEIARNPLLAGTAFLAGGVGFFAAVQAIFGTTAVIAAGAALGLGAVVAAFDGFIDSAAEAHTAVMRLDEAQTQALSNTARYAANALDLATEYGKLAIALRENEVQEDKVEDVRNRMAGILRQLNTLSPAYREAVEGLTGAEEDYAEATKEVIRQKRAEILLQIAANRVAQVAAEERLALVEQERQAVGGRFGWSTAILRFFEDTILPGGIQRRQEVEALREEIESMIANGEDLKEFLATLDEILARTALRVEGPETDDADKIKVQRAALEGELAELDAYFKQAEAVLKDRLDRNVISYQQFVGQMMSLLRYVYGERIRINNELAAIEEEDENRRQRAEAKAIAAQAELNVKLLELEQDLREHAKKRAQERVELESEILSAIGREAEATKRKLLQQYSETIAALRNEGEEGLRQIGLIFQRIRTEVAEKSLQSLQESLSRAMQRMRDKQQAIELQVEIGAMTQEDAQFAVADVYEEYATLLRRLIPLAEEFALQIGDEESMAQVEEYKASLADIEGQIQNLRDGWREFRLQVGQAAQQELANYLTKAVTEAESLGDAFTNLIGSLEGVRNLLGQIAQQIVEITARAIAMKAVEAAFSVAGFPLPKLGFAHGGPVVALAGGGRISGPGTSTSDSVLARLSAGEYVVRAAAVKKYGTGFMNDLNLGLLPRQIANLKQYATGGVVGAERPVATTQEFKGQMTIGLSEGLVVQQMDTPEGERFILRVLQKNRRGVLKGLGI